MKCTEVAQLAVIVFVAQLLLN